MRVIVSKTLADNFNNYILVDSLKKAVNCKGVDILVIHSFVESEFDAGVFISKLKESGVSRFFYLSKKPITTIRMLVNGTGGYFSDEEFYFDNEEELDSLIEDVMDGDESGANDEYTAIAAPALNTITNFMKGFVNGDKLVSTPLYLDTVNAAINDLTELTQQQTRQISAMGSSAIEVFEKASQIIVNMDNQRKLIEKKLEELEYSTANAVSSKPAFGNNIVFFAPYKYIGNAKVCVIREYAPCRYLTSFVLGYLSHLHYELNRRPKLIFVHQKGQGVSSKYSAYTSITQETSGMPSLYDAEVIATNNPKKEVLKDLLSKPNDVILVVDRLYSKDTIVTGRVTSINAVGSRSDIKRYNIKPEDTIFSVTAQPKQLFTISTIKNFPVEVDARIATYHQTMGTKYKLLDKKFHIDG